jgi:hypothetical protein
MKRYTIEDLLIDTQYRNSIGQIGTITNAIKREDVYIPGNTEAYAIQYYVPQFGSQWATVAVKLENN